MLRILLIILVALAVIIGLMKLTGSRPADPVQSVQKDAGAESLPESLPQENASGDEAVAGEEVGVGDGVESGASEGEIEGPALAIEAADEIPESGADVASDAPPAEEAQTAVPNQ